MIRSLLIFTLLAVGLQTPCKAAELNAARLAEQIRQVEPFQGRDGAAGELGPWQITRAVWQQHMGAVPFAQARLEGPARACALKHIAWLRAGLRAAGWADTPYNVALAWNAGLARATGGRAPARARDYAQRVANLYQEAGR